jgi:hypothetical protein
MVCWWNTHTYIHTHCLGWFVDDECRACRRLVPRWPSVRKTRQRVEQEQKSKVQTGWRRYTRVINPCFLGCLQRASLGRALQVPSAPLHFWIKIAVDLWTYLFPCCIQDSFFLNQSETLQSPLSTEQNWCKRNPYVITGFTHTQAP